MIPRKTKYTTSLTLSEINSILSQLERRRFKVRSDGSAFSIREKLSNDEYDNINATAHGEFYSSYGQTFVSLIFKPSTIALVLTPLITLFIFVSIIFYPEQIETTEDIVTNSFARWILVGFFFLFLIPITYGTLIYPMHQIKYFVENELQLQEIL